MPPILAAFFVLSGLLHGSTLIHSVKGVDPTAQVKMGKPTPIFYRAWATPNDTNYTTGKGCNVTFYFLTNQRGGTRLRIGGQEQLVDTSWKIPQFIHKDHVMRIHYMFISPLPGVLYQEGTVEATCVDRIRVYNELKEQGWILR